MTSIASSAERLKSNLGGCLQGLDLVDERDVAAACASAGHRWRSCFWSPRMTLVTFLRQVLHGNCSCRSAVAMTLAAEDRRAVDAAQSPSGLSIDGPASDPSAYSQARQRLPRCVLESLNDRVVDRARQEVGGTQTWCRRNVVIVDGSSATTPDVPPLQKVYPQPSGQKAGCGFPVIRLLAIFCWASGCLLEWAADSLHVSELVLFRRLLSRLKPEAVVLGDTYYSSYYDLVLLKQHRLDGVFHLHQRRSTDLRQGTRLGEGDRLLTWTKPKNPPRGLAANEWEQVPESLTVRHVQCRIEIPGFRSRKLNVVTTLLDPVAFPKADLTQLYRDRWLVELNLRSLKTTLGMEALKGQSRDMVLKELMIYQLAYNLIRLLMWRAAAVHQVDPRWLSFAGTQQRLQAILPHLLARRTKHQTRALVALLLARIAADLLPERPNRIEPRAVKRRPKNYRRLTRPRHDARKMEYFING